jgi:hypothetical protein
LQLLDVQLKTNLKIQTLIFLKLEVCESRLQTAVYLPIWDGGPKTIVAVSPFHFFSDRSSLVKSEMNGTVIDELSREEECKTIKKKLCMQDGKIFLLSGQLEKQKILHQQTLKELESLKNGMHSVQQKLEIEKVSSNEVEVKRVTDGKLFLLQYQLEKSKVLNTELKKRDFDLYDLLIHRNKSQEFLKQIQSSTHRLPKFTRGKVTSDGQPGVSQSFYSRVFDKEHNNEIKSYTPELHLKSVGHNGELPNNSSLFVSKFITNESLATYHSDLDISSHTLNTTFDHGYSHSFHKESFVQTPLIDHWKNPKRSTMSELPNVPATFSKLKTKENSYLALNEIVLNEESQRNMMHLNHDVNKNSFSVFLSPNAFRENISRIRKENEKLRNDISRFRGKLEVKIFDIYSVVLSKYFSLFRV